MRLPARGKQTATPLTSQLMGTSKKPQNKVGSMASPMMLYVMANAMISDKGDDHRAWMCQASCLISTRGYAPRQLH